jgi:hypothetical protein
MYRTYEYKVESIVFFTLFAVLVNSLRPAPKTTALEKNGTRHYGYNMRLEQR